MKKYFINVDDAFEKFGYLPKMATASKGSIGSFMASSFCERINSAANLILTLGNTLLSDEEIDMLVVLRMNRDFLNFMHLHYSHIVKLPFKETIITVEQNTETDE